MIQEIENLKETLRDKIKVYSLKIVETETPSSYYHYLCGKKDMLEEIIGHIESEYEHDNEN